VYRVTCKQCGASVITDDGNSDRLACQCCPVAHSHEEAANACPGATGTNDLTTQHAGAPCPHPSPNGRECNAITPVPGASNLAPEGEDCPGGHCWPGVEGCTVCRPCNIEWIGQIVPLGAGAAQ
jgi:hypothetical protein